MKFLNPKVFLLFSLLPGFFAFPSAWGQNSGLRNQVFNKNVYTVQTGIVGVEISEPFIPLTGNLQLEVIFDVLGEEAPQLSYEIIHCNADWKPSALRPTEFYDGFWKDAITNFDYSFNTIVPFTNYQFRIPGNGQRFLHSGNYIVRIFNTNDEDDLYFQERVVVYEETNKVVANAKQPDRMYMRNTHQEIDFTVYHSGLEVGPGTMRPTATIVKNGDWSTAIERLEARFIRPKELVFDYDTGNVFLAGNEYRYFDLRDLSFNSERVYRMDKSATPFFVQLYRDADRSNQRYTNYNDINGHFVVFNAQGTEPPYDSDYLQTFFSIPADYPLNEGELYVMGDFNLGGKDPRFRMEYNQERKQYEALILVKQGFYNYYYALYEEHYPVEPYKEGNHWETENQYQICVYYRALTDQADRCVGFTSVNSILK